MSSEQIARLKQRVSVEAPKRPTVILGQALRASAIPPRNTPAYYEYRLKEQKRAQREAAKVAQQSAARYNLTLRAYALSSAKLADDERQRQLEEAKKAKQLANQYNATVRALRVSMGGVKSVGSTATESKKMDFAHATPTIIEEEVKSEATTSFTDKTPIGTHSRQDSNTETKTDEDPVVSVIKTKPEAQPVDPETPKVSRTSTSSESSIEELKLAEVESALKKGDDAAINEAVLRSYFDAVDPARASEVPKLLEEYKGREEELMNDILRETKTPEVEIERVEESLVHVESEPVPVDFGFITGADTTNRRKVSVSTVIDPEMEALRKKLLERGLSANVIKKVIDDTSEML